MKKGKGAYKSDKRRKEVDRQKKQEEKRQNRLNKRSGLESDQDDNPPVSEETGTGAAEQETEGPRDDQ